jgi:protein-glutamine gamma-glutamyltransferase
MPLANAQAAERVPVEPDIHDALRAPPAEIEVGPALNDAEKQSLGLRISVASRIRNPQSAIRNYIVPGLGSWLALGLLLLIVLNLGWIAGSLLYRRVEVINFLPAWLSHGNVPVENTTGPLFQVGFSTSGELSTIQRIKDDPDTTPVLTIAGNNPSYLRAKAFVSYHQSAWQELISWEAIVPEQNLPLGMHLGRTSLYRLHEAEASREITIRHESGLGDVMFAPAGACFVEAPFGVMRNEDEIIKSQNVRTHQSYRIGYAASLSSRPPTSLQLHHLMELPTRSLDDLPQIRQKASRIFRGCTTTAQKIDAVTKYFHTNYTYVLGLEVPTGQDPLNYFLSQASTGYCEYFASGAAILLRLADVPTRYVTGFLVTERGPEKGSWIARNMDAHAWAEAWDKEQGQWVVVEATTQEGLDEVSLADELVRSAGSTRPFLTRLLQSLYEYGLFGVVGQFFVSYGLLTGVGLALVFLGAAGWVAVRRQQRPYSLALRPLSAEVLAWRRLLAAVDRQARARGYWRRGDETLHAFAARLAAVGAGAGAASGTSDDRLPASLAEWYFRYADLRYRRAIEPGAAQASLASLWAQARGVGAKLGRIERLRQIIHKRPGS